MTRVAEAIRHPVLARARGARPEAAEISDRARIGVVLQAAGLLSLCEIAGWRLAGDLHGARVDGEGRLTGLVAEPGRAEPGAVPVLLSLLRRLFRTDGEVKGRGEARRAARALIDRWEGSLHRAPADRAVEDLLAAAPFLAGKTHRPAREALRGRLVREGVEITWSAGREGPSPSAGRDPVELVRRRRWHAAALAFRERPPKGAAERRAAALAAYGAGRAEAALALLGGLDDPAAETLRASCRHVLGDLAGARECVRRLEAAELSFTELAEASDAALRVFAVARETDAARDWVARMTRCARGSGRTLSTLLAAVAAGDRGETGAMRDLLAGVGGVEGDPALEDRWHEAMAQLAWDEQDTEGIARHVGCRLRIARRWMTRFDAARAWNQLGLGRSLGGRFGEAERAFEHAARLLSGCDGPLRKTLAAVNLADVRLRVGRLDGVEPILRSSAAWNRRSGNRGALAVDALVALRLELVRGRLEAGLARARELRERLDEWGLDAPRGRLAVLEARALGWLGRPVEARRSLEGLPPADLQELEPEERPFLFALAGDTDRALAEAAGSGLPELAGALVAGDEAPRDLWRETSRLEPYRRARLVLDADLLVPGSVPSERREEAAEVFRNLGAYRLASLVERARTVAWRALGEYFEKPGGDREAVEALLAAVGHAEAELVLRSSDGERRLAGPGGRVLPAERSVRLGDGELVLRAEEIDEPLRALFALFAREVPAPRSAGDSRVRGGLRGESPALLEAIGRLDRFARTRLPVLILGENGTGKELAATVVHERSGRSGRHVPLNCAGLPESLLLSELFGHARGAFTGADRERAGLFESARGGTAFLDEIGDLPLSAQGSLLRVLQEGEVRRVGEALARRVDVRFVSATHRPLEVMVEEGKFRRDLFFRLKAATVTLPPLRDRGHDVLLLADLFLRAERRSRPELRLTPEARRALLAHSWPGNVRELKNVIEAAAALADDGRIAPEHFDLGTAPPPPKGCRPGDYHAEVEAFRRRLLTEALEACEGNLAAAARRLGVSRQYLSQYVHKHGLRLRAR